MLEETGAGTPRAARITDGSWCNRVIRRISADAPVRFANVLAIDTENVACFVQRISSEIGDGPGEDGLMPRRFLVQWLPPGSTATCANSYVAVAF